MTALRQKPPLASSKSDFRLTPESGPNLEITECPKSAKQWKSAVLFDDLAR